MSQPCHIFTATGLSRVQAEFSREDWGRDAHSPAEAHGTHLWLEYQDPVAQQYYIELLLGRRAEVIWLGTLLKTEIWQFKNSDLFPQLFSVPAMHSPISRYSFVPRGVFHFEGSLHYVSWKAEVLERSKGSWRSSSPVRQPGTAWLQLFRHMNNK